MSPTRLLKTYLNCVVCSRDFVIKEHRIFYLRYLPKVCSIDCFLNLLKEGQPPEYLEQMSFAIRNNLYIQDNYKSSWEVDFAKFLKQNKINFLYEPFAFNVFGNKYYIPDFYLPDSGIFIEIKGVWEQHAKNKFQFFVTNFGFRTYLLNDTFIEFVRRGKW